MNAKLNISLILCILSLAIATLACGFSSPVQNPSSAPEKVPQNDSISTQVIPAVAAPTSVSIVVDPEVTIHNVIAATLTAPAYRTTITITSTNSLIETKAEVILPDRFHITSTRKNKTTEMIIANGKAYTKTNGAWTESTQDMSSLTASFASAVGKDTTISDVKFVKPDVVDGIPALVYSFNSLYKSGDMEVNTATMMWVDPLNGLPIKMVEDSVYSGTKSHIEQSIVYDPSITIEAPKP
jgi:hypothetical protein